MAKHKNPHLGSTFDSFLKEERILEEVEARVAKRIADAKASKAHQFFFGNSEHSYDPAQYRGGVLLEHEPFTRVGKQLGLQQLVFLHQVHGTDGAVITNANEKIPSFVVDGDYLLTNVPNIGLGISTADCLPVIMVDRGVFRPHPSIHFATQNTQDERAADAGVIGAIHAGWRGACAGILEKVIRHAQAEFGSRVEDLAFTFGPSAQGCCYEVQAPFMDEFVMYPFAKEAFSKKGDKLYFDLPKFAALQLASLGVKNIERSDVCTICTPGYCSVRNSPGSVQRQMTVATLTKI